jgi:NADH-quinone oxidoreductase subunit C
MDHKAVLDKLREKFGDVIASSSFRDNPRVFVPANQLFDVMNLLKSDCGFDQLSELTAVDYLRYPGAKDRYAVIYGLLNTRTGLRLYVKTFVNDPDPEVKSVYPLWKGADWLEREVFDMYGIDFPGHPDLRRILLPPEFASYPMRKDYPLRGRGERHNFPVVTRAEG